MQRLENLNELNDKLTGLLKDPHPGLFTWKSALAETITEISNYAPEDKSKKAIIRAECHSDDFLMKVDFDAHDWFMQASDRDIISLMDCGFRGDYPADEVALFMAKACPDIKRMFEHVESLDDMGFECVIDVEDAIEWLKSKKPVLKS